MEKYGVEYVGKIQLGKECMVSDPGYVDGEWCQHLLDNMLPGTYNCFLSKRDCGEFGIRISKILIFHEDYILYPSNLVDCEIGVDGGQAGFYDYEYFKETRDDEKWKQATWDIVKGCKDKKCFITLSGYGDGFYPLYIGVNSEQHIVSAMVVFIDENEEKDEE